MQPLRVPLATKIKQQIEKAGYFSRIKLNSIYVPRQLRVQFTAKNRASDAGKPITGAATLFLLPMEHEIDFVASFSMECRGAIVGAWEYAERVAQTQFLLIEPDSAETNVVASTVSRFIRSRVWETQGRLCVIIPAPAKYASSRAIHPAFSSSVAKLASKLLRASRYHMAASKPNAACTARMLALR